MKLGLIYARSRNGVIGKDGELPWRVPEDLAICGFGWRGEVMETTELDPANEVWIAADG